MPEAGGFLLHHHHHHHHRDQVQSSLRSGFRTTATALDASPDSVIFTLESNFSLFSSASASVERCSFTSDALDHDSLASSDISLHLAGHEGGGGGGGGGSSDQLHRQESNGWSGPDRDSDPKKVSDAAAAAARSSTKKHNHNRSHPRLKVAKASAQNQNQNKKEDNNGAADDASAATVDDDSDQFLDSARSSFSLALKECQDRRARSEAFARKLDRRRPASLDLNNVAAAAASSPRLGTMKKASVSSSSRPSGGGNFPSPGTPNYRLGMQKGWSSERVPLPNGVNRRIVNAAAALLPFNNNGRTLPSKWEDAERWIFSPISGDGPMRTSVQQAPHQRRPKSKSGPLGPPGVAYYSLFSPAAPAFDGIGGSVGNFVAGSPFSTGVIAADGLAMRSSNAHGLAFPPKGEPCMARSVSVHGCSDMVGQSSLPFQDEKHEGVKDAATDISRTVSRRDMATQMSPEGSKNSSPSRRLSFSASTPSALPIVEVQSVHSYKSEVRDVQVDERVTFTRWSKKHRNRNNGTTSGSIDSWRKKVGDAPSCPWDASEAAKSISKVKREEAKITAWENLQKAKAEAAMRKLEMKLEKKRSSSIDKIMSKLKSAQKKAQEMRSSVLANQAHQVSRTSHKAISFRRTRHMGSLSGCFTCHAF